MVLGCHLLVSASRDVACTGGVSSLEIACQSLLEQCSCYDPRRVLRRQRRSGDGGDERGRWLRKRQREERSVCLCTLHDFPHIQRSQPRPRRRAERFAHSARRLVHCCLRFCAREERANLHDVQRAHQQDASLAAIAHVVARARNNFSNIVKSRSALSKPSACLLAFTHSIPPCLLSLEGRQKGSVS